MLTFAIYFFTALIVLDCIFLVMLVLIQLPKKEAGMGQAFGGAATDALFGAGSGNVLTKATKWGAGIFFGLAIALTVMGSYKSSSGAGRLQRIMQENKPSAVVPPPTPTVPNTTANPAIPNVPAPAPGNAGNPPAQNVPAVPAQNPPANPSK